MCWRHLTKKGNHFYYAISQAGLTFNINIWLIQSDTPTVLMEDGYYYNFDLSLFL